MKSIIKLLLNSLAIIIIAYLLPGFDIIEPQYAIVAALFLSLVNVIIKPILLFLTFPITLVTLGLFVFVINALLFWGATAISPGVVIAGFGTAFIGSILFSLISWALQAVLTD